MKTAAFLTTLCLAFCGLAHAQSVALSGMLGGKALLIVDGGPPKTVAVGDTFKGVKVVSTKGDEAVLEIEGKRHTVRVGEACDLPDRLDRARDVRGMRDHDQVRVTGHRARESLQVDKPVLINTDLRDLDFRPLAEFGQWPQHRVMLDNRRDDAVAATREALAITI